MYRWLYNRLRNSRMANYCLHVLVESDVLNWFPPYQLLYRILISHRARKWFKKPPFLEITVTDRCNADCSMCPPEVHRGHTVIAMSCCRSIIDQAAEVGIRKLILTGGEPLLDPEIYEKISYAKDARFTYVHMFTNGQLLSKSNALRLMEAGLDSITVSIDSVVREEYTSIRRGLDFDRVMEHIRCFKQWRTEAGYTKPLFRLNRVNVPENRNSAARFISELRTCADVVELIDAHNWAAREHNRFMGGALFGSAVRYPCNLLFQKIVINPLGQFRKCSIDYNQHAVVGTAESATISEVLESRLGDIKRRMLRNDFSEPGCRECGYKQSWWVDWSL